MLNCALLTSLLVSAYLSVEVIDSLFFANFQSLFVFTKTEKRQFYLTEESRQFQTLCGKN